MTPLGPDMPRVRAFTAIGRERLRQNELKEKGRFTHTAADDVPRAMKLAMLVEEVGEVAREVLTQPGEALALDTAGSAADLRKELIHVAAIAVAWLESESIQ